MSGSCLTLPSYSNIIPISSVCSGVIDYPFYLPNGFSLAYLNDQAKLKLNDDRLSILPSTCQMDIKKLVCSSIYLKCLPNINLQDSTTWNYHIYSDVGLSTIGLPFQRHCMSVCLYTTSSCFGLLKLMGLDVNCQSKFAYVPSVPLLPYQFDQSQNNLYCNAMNNTYYKIAGTVEPYIKSPIYGGNGHGACSGIVDRLFVPPGPSVSDEFAPMQPSYAMQSVVEAQLSTVFSRLPRWLSPTCRYSLKKYFCSSYMLKPQIQLISSILLSQGLPLSVLKAVLGSNGVNTSSFLAYSFYLPSYPDNQLVCESYASSCSAFIATSGIAILVPDCNSSVTNTTIKKFPSSTQTIVSLSLIPGSIVKFRTDPNQLLDAENTEGYIPSCPIGYQIPDSNAVTDPSTVIFPGSLCCVQCQYVINIIEWFNFVKFHIYFMFLGILFLLHRNGILFIY